MYYLLDCFPGAIAMSDSISPCANAVIFYHPDGYDTARPRLMGRQAAGEGFLRAFVRHGGVDRLYCHASSAALAKDFAGRVKGYGAKVPVGWVPLTRPEGLAELGCLYYPGPDINPLVWRRRSRGQRGYSVVGITHTTATHAVMDAVAGWLTAPVQPWDAVICTSRSVRDTMQVMLEAQAEYLRTRLGATRFSAPQLPVIPLGVACDDFTARPEARAQWRGKLGIAETDLAVLYMGRLSLHGKAHPLAMYRALQQAVAAAPKGSKVHLIQAGWFATPAVEKAFREGVARYCPDVSCAFVDGRDPKTRAEIWHAADIFCSLADNVQETFGLTPIEAMAAGLPVVVSDWDGYRDTVRDAEDGFRIPTLMPPPPHGLDLADRFAAGIDSYDRYAAFTSQLISVDTAAAAKAFARLFQDAALRRRLGASGQAHARQNFDWRVIIAKYQTLWSELAERRKSAPETAPLATMVPPTPAGEPARAPVPTPNALAMSNPSRPDPFLIFRSYPTRFFHHAWQVSLVPGTTPAELKDRLASPMADFATDILPPADVLAAMLTDLTSGPAPVAVLIDSLPPQTRASAFRALAWLAKMDFVQLTPPPPKPEA